MISPYLAAQNTRIGRVNSVPEMGLYIDWKMRFH